MDLLELIRQELIKEGHRCAPITLADWHIRQPELNLLTTGASAVIVARLTLNNQTTIHIDVWWPHSILVKVADIDLTEPGSVPRLIEYLDPLKPNHIGPNGIRVLAGFERRIAQA